MGEQNRFEQKQVGEKQELQELSFDAGVETALESIRQKLETQDWVVVTICGSANDVGKTTLGGQVGQRLSQQGIPYTSHYDISRLTPLLKEEIDRVLRYSQASEKLKNKFVLIFNPVGEKVVPPGMSKLQVEEMDNSRLKTEAEKIGLLITKVDIRILIQRPDRPFDREYPMLFDILINNEKAIDSPYKSR